MPELDPGSHDDLSSLDPVNDFSKDCRDAGVMAVIDEVEAARPPASAVSAAKAWQRALEMTGPIGRDPVLTLPLVIDAVAGRFPTSPALLSEMETLSYRDLALLSRRYAGWALRHGVGKGDVVALMMPNCPQYFAIWLGIARVGGIVALVNTNLVGASLRHSLDTVAPKHLIVDATLLVAVAAIFPVPGGKFTFHTLRASGASTYASCDSFGEGFTLNIFCACASSSYVSI
jgi:non-ribosomal peptide synthetase component F